MNMDALKRAEGAFLSKYPGGFLDPELQAITKKHKMGKMIELAQTELKKARFRDPQAAAETMSKLISRSSLVSIYEKPKFRDAIPTLEPADLKKLTNGLKHLLYDNQQAGLEAMVNTLAPLKLAKWSLITVLPNYVHPDDEVFVKPTTAKGVINTFGLTDLSYHPLPTWDFYARYRDAIRTMKRHVDPTLTTSNAAFCGFLMMSL